MELVERLGLIQMVLCMDCMQGGIGDLHYRQQQQLLINNALSIMAMHNYINTVSMQLPQRARACAQRTDCSVSERVGELARQCTKECFILSE